MHRLLAVIVGLSLAASANAQTTKPHELPPGWTPKQTDDMSALAYRAGKLVEAGEYAEATSHFLWLWDHALEHDLYMVGSRTSFMAGEMQELAEAYAPAKAAFALKRDAVEASFAEEPSRVSADTLNDWVTLNEVVGDDGRTLAWFDAHAGKPEAAAALERVLLSVKRILLERNRFADVAKLYPDPIAAARQHARLYRRMGGPRELAMELPEEDSTAIWIYLEEISTLYAALLAAGRDAEAAELLRVATIPSRDLPDERPAMVAKAVEFGVARPEHRKLLDDAESDGADVTEVRASLEASLARPTTNPA